jgi:hypothetical protein
MPLVNIPRVRLCCPDADVADAADAPNSPGLCGSPRPALLVPLYFAAGPPN